MGQENYQPGRLLSKKERLFLFGKIFGSSLLLFFLLSRLQVELIWQAIQTSRIEYLLIGLGLGFVFLLIRGYKWFNILKPYLAVPRFKRVLVAYMYGLGVGILTPGRVGELARIANIDLKDKAGPSGLFLLDKFLDLIVVTGMAIVGGYFLFPSKISNWIFTGFAVGAVLLLLVIRRTHLLVEGRFKNVPLAEKVNHLFKAISSVERSKLALNVVLTFFSYIICVFEVYFILKAFGAVKLIHVMLVHPIVMLTNAIPITIGGLGLREGTSVLLYSQLGIMKEHAFWGAFLVFVFNTFLYGVLGVILINFMKKESE